MFFFFRLHQIYKSGVLFFSSFSEGFIPTADIAVKIAECVLLEIYGKESIEKEKPFSVNLVNGIWVIEGHIPNGNDSALTFCGQSYVEIRKSNGEIIKLLHTK